MSTDVISVLRRIRACEGEAAAQVVLDHFVRVRADEAYERAAQVADGFTCGGCGMDGKCSKAIRALKSSAPTNEIGNARMGGE